MEMQTPVPRLRTVITPHETQPFRHFPMEKFPCGSMLRTGVPIHLRGKSAIFRQWRGNGATCVRSRIMDPDELRSRLGMWRWRMHATWEPLIAWCNRIILTPYLASSNTIPWRRACRNVNPYSMSDFNALMGFG